MKDSAKVPTWAKNLQDEVYILNQQLIPDVVPVIARITTSRRKGGPLYPITMPYLEILS